MSTMFRRISSVIRGKDKDGQEKRSKRKSMPNSTPMANGKTQRDGWPLTNGDLDGGADSGSHGDATKFDRESSGAVAGYPDPPDHGHSRVDIGRAMDSLSNLVSHSMRPMPEKFGDGSYEKEDPHPSLFKELKTIGLADVKTLREKLEVGKDPVDDKTMLVKSPAAQKTFTCLLMAPTIRWNE